MSPCLVANVSVSGSDERREARFPLFERGAPILSSVRSSTLATSARGMLDAYGTATQAAQLYAAQGSPELSTLELATEKVPRE